MQKRLSMHKDKITQMKMEFVTQMISQQQQLTLLRMISLEIIVNLDLKGQRSPLSLLQLVPRQHQYKKMLISSQKLMQKTKHNFMSVKMDKIMRTQMENVFRLSSRARKNILEQNFSQGMIVHQVRNEHQ